MSETTELWELIGTFWRMPIAVQWIDAIAMVQVADVPLLNRQVTAITSFLHEAGAQERSSIFYIRRDLLKRIAIPSAAKDPEEIVQWMPAAPPLTQAQDPTFEQDWKPSEFVADYCASSFAVIHDRLIADAIFVSFCKFMLHQLMNRQKQVDLIFIRLCPFLFRANWKGTVARHDRKPSAGVKAKKGIGKLGLFSPRIETMIRRGLADYMCSEHVVAFDRENKVCLWRIEVLPQAMFLRMSSRLERERKRRTKFGYFYWVAEQLKRQLPDALKVYSAWLTQASLPTVRLPTRYFVGGEDENQTRRECVGQVRHRASADAANCPPITVPDAAKSSPRLQGEMEEADDLLPEMRDIQP